MQSFISKCLFHGWVFLTQMVIDNISCFMFLCCSIRGYQSLVDIIVCTPGRLVDHINKTPGFDLTHLRFLVSRIDKFFTLYTWKHTHLMFVSVCLFIWWQENEYNFPSLVVLAKIVYICR